MIATDFRYTCIYSFNFFATFRPWDYVIFKAYAATKYSIFVFTLLHLKLMRGWSKIFLSRSPKNVEFLLI